MKRPAPSAAPSRFFATRAPRFSNSISLAQGAQWEERLASIGEAGRRAGLAPRRNARSRRYVDLHHRHEHEPRDAVACSRQADDCAVDPRRKVAATGFQTEQPIVMLTAYTMRMAQLLDPHCDMLLGRRQPWPGHLRPAFDDPRHAGHDVRTWRGGGSRQLARAGRRRHAVRELRSLARPGVRIRCTDHEGNRLCGA